jgi:hypothetical protein
MISVLVPTANRPAFLKHAIESIRNQSKRELIGEIIVSNNGEIDVSEVVNSFPDLQISYITQTPQLDPGKHFSWLVSQARCPLIAMLADDDMWGRYHLEEADRLLKKHSDAVAVFSQTISVKNVCRQPLSGLGELAHSLIQVDDCLFDDAFVFQANQILIDCLIRTPLDIWGMVGKKMIVLKHMQVFSEEKSGIDADRFFIWRLNTEGPIVCAREVGLFLRVHDGMAGIEMREIDQKYYLAKSNEYTLKMIEEANALGIAAKEIWQSFWERLREEERAKLVLGHNYVGETSKILGYPQTNDYGVPMRQRLAIIIRDFLPPVFFRSLQRFRNRMLIRR